VAGFRETRGLGFGVPATTQTWFVSRAIENLRA
jgi:hypothetical protein